MDHQTVQDPEVQEVQDMGALNFHIRWVQAQTMVHGITDPHKVDPMDDLMAHRPEEEEEDISIPI